MKNVMKVLISLIILCTVSEANAQISAGAGVVYGTDISSIGFSLNGKYTINETWSAAPAFTLFLKKNDINWSALDLDANYQLSSIDKLGGLYALAGLNVTFFKFSYSYDLGAFGGLIEDSTTGSDVGVNLGLGLDIPLAEKFTVAPELRYTLGGANYLRFGAKLLYTF